MIRNDITIRPETPADYNEIAQLVRLGLEAARQTDRKGILVEGDFHFYNRLGFETSADHGIHATSGFPLNEPRCMMCMESQPGSLSGISGYVVYDMYENA